MMSFNLEFFEKLIILIHLTPINPMKILFYMFTKSEVAAESYSIKQGVSLFLSISLKNSFRGVFTKAAG